MVVDNPPSYDAATAGSSAKQSPQPAQQHAQQPQPSHAQEAPHEPPKQGPLLPAPSPHAAPYRDYPHAGGPATHHYVNPRTGAHIVTYLPPDHPEMICLQRGEHVSRTSFGLLGVLAAVFFFPLGVALCLIDRRVKCERCGRVLEDGVSCG